MAPELLYGIGAVVLLAALIWGTNRYRQRSREQKLRGDQKTRELFRREEQ